MKIIAETEAEARETARALARAVGGSDVSGSPELMDLLLQLQAQARANGWAR